MSAKIQVNQPTLIPEAIKAEIQSRLNVKILNDTPLHGGDINSAARLDLDNDSSVFIKWNTDTPSDMFSSEAEGLELLATADCGLHIPAVILQSEQFLVIEFIEESPTGDSFDFGVQLAQMHKKSNELFGLQESNYIGRLSQSNKYHPDWLEFFFRERLEPQVKMAIDSGKLEPGLGAIFDRVMNYTYIRFPEEPPALLHGDLWAGNYMFTTDGKTSIYDPAVYFGHREMDLAMTHLFGGFEPEFYHGYMKEYPLEEGYEERFKLCNLYPILVHANLFGGSYTRKAETLLRQFF